MSIMDIFFHGWNLNYDGCIASNMDRKLSFVDKLNMWIAREW
jgi:hypothetical protein